MVPSSPRTRRNQTRQAAGDTHGLPSSGQQIPSGQPSAGTQRCTQTPGTLHGSGAEPRPQQLPAGTGRRGAAGGHNFLRAQSREVLLQPQLHPYLIPSNYAHILLDK